MALEGFRQFRQYRNNLELKEYWGTAPPSLSSDQGPFALGDVVWDTTPSLTPGSPLGWICVSPGSAGNTSTWLPIQLALSTLTAITAGTTRTQAGATVLTAGMNRVDTSTAVAAGTILGDGVALPSVASVISGGGGAEVVVINTTANLIQVYSAVGSGDNINGVAGTIGIAMAPGDVARFEADAPNDWRVETGLGTAGSLPTMVSADNVTAAGSSQATAFQLGAMLNNVTTVASGTGVNLPASKSGLSITIQNNGANQLLVYAFQGSSDTIDGVVAANGVSILPGAVGEFNCTTAGAWTAMVTTTKNAAFNSAANAAGFTATGAQISGGAASVDLALTGTLGAGANITLPTVASLLLALHAPTAGTSYRLRIINESSANFAWTVVTNTGWTLTGTMTIAQNTWREFTVSITSIGSATATLQSLATGTFS